RQLLVLVLVLVLPSSMSGSCGAAAISGTLVDRLGDPEGSAFETAIRRTKRLDVAAAFEQFAKHEAVVLHFLEERGLEQIAVAVERLLGRINERFGLVPELDELAPKGVDLLELLPLADEPVDLVLGEPARRRDANLLAAPRPEVLSLDA